MPAVAGVAEVAAVLELGSSSVTRAVSNWQLRTQFNSGAIRYAGIRLSIDCLEACVDSFRRYPAENFVNGTLSFLPGGA